MSTSNCSGIPRYPQAPEKLSDAAITALTELCFGDQSSIIGPLTAEAAVVFGTSNIGHLYAISLMIADLIRRTGLRIVYLTGGTIHGDVTQSELLQHTIGADGYATVKFRTDRISLTTLGNVRSAVLQGLFGYANVVFITKHSHCGRARMTLERYLGPKRHKLFQAGYAQIIPGVPGLMKPDNWTRHQKWIERVWGEFLRIREYGLRGDIFYTDETAELVGKIETLTGTATAEPVTA